MKSIHSNTHVSFAEIGIIFFHLLSWVCYVYIAYKYNSYTTLSFFISLQPHKKSYGNVALRLVKLDLIIIIMYFVRCRIYLKFIVFEFCNLFIIASDDIKEEIIINKYIFCEIK